MVKKILIMLIVVVFYVNAQDCYSVYHYIDKHSIRTAMNHKISRKKPKIDARLHVRNLGNNNTNYSIFWLENGTIDKALVDKDSIYAPFIVKRSEKKEEFQILTLNSLSKDKIIKQRLMSIVDSLQYKAKAGKYYFHNAIGTLDVVQHNINDSYIIERLNQYEKNTQAYNTKYFYSEANVTIDKNCSIWSSVSAKEKIKFYVDLMKTTMVDERVFTMTKSKQNLPKTHWFFKLSTDISLWNFSKKANPLSLSDALKTFDQYQQEIHVLLNDHDKFQEWILSHMNFLQHLNNMLKAKILDNEVSKALFAKLGYINTVESSRILTQVLLDTDLNDRDRFRSLMGLKNTSVPLDDELLYDIIEYGFSSGENNIIKNATGMLIGTLARVRIDRVAEQYEQLSESIIDAIGKSENKTVALSAAGNMLQTASDKIVETVDDVLASDPDALNRKKSAEALSQIGRTNLDTASFQHLMEKEDNSDTLAQLIRTSATAKDFKSNDQYKQFLVDMADNRAGVLSNRLTALETLEKADFGKDSINKTKIRKMMLNEKDRDISKILKKLYRDK